MLSPLLMGLITFIIIHNSDQILDVAMIYSTIEILQYIRTNVIVYSGFGMSFVVESK
jgi:hypothetical protein